MLAVVSVIYGLYALDLAWSGLLFLLDFGPEVGVYTSGDMLAALEEHDLTPVTVRPLMRWPALRHELVARKHRD